MLKDAHKNKNAQKTAEDLHGECLTQYIDKELTVENMTIDEEPTVENMTIDEEPTEKKMTIHPKTARMRSIRKKRGRAQQRKVSFTHGTVQFFSKAELYKDEVPTKGNDLGRCEYPTAAPASGSLRITRGEKAVKECMTAAQFVSTLHTA